MRNMTKSELTHYDNCKSDAQKARFRAAVATDEAERTQFNDLAQAWEKQARSIRYRGLEVIQGGKK